MTVKFRTFSCPFHEMVSTFFIHFTKWTNVFFPSVKWTVWLPFHEKKLGQDPCVLGNDCLICEGF